MELVAAELPEVDVHFVMQHAVAASHATHEPQRRAGLDLLRTMAPLLRRRASGSSGAAPEAYAEQILEWVADELKLVSADVQALPQP